MRFIFTRPRNKVPAIASQLDLVAGELVPALGEASVVERGPGRSGQRS